MVIMKTVAIKDKAIRILVEVGSMPENGDPSTCEFTPIALGRGILTDEVAGEEAAVELFRKVYREAQDRVQ